MTLDFKALRRELILPDPRGSWAGELRQIDPDLLTRKIRRADVVKIVDHATNLIAENERTAASNWLALAMLAHQDKTFESIRKRGTFRLSKYDFAFEAVRFVVARISGWSARMNLTENNVEYLKSVKNLQYFGKSLHRVVKSIRNAAREREDLYVKSVIACADAHFMQPRQTVESKSRSDTQHFTIEELAEGASFLIHLFLQDRELTSRDFMLLDEEGIVSGFYNREITKGAKIRQFMEAEIMLDGFDYRCSRSQKTVIIQPKEANFEKSIRLSYVLNDQARANANIMARSAQQDGHQSIIEVSDRVFDEHRDLLVHLATNPIPRITLRIPEQPTFDHIISPHQFFLEEYIELAEAKESELLTWDEIDIVEIEPGLKAVDLIRVFRFFRFASRILARELTEVMADQPELAYRSLLPVFTQAKIIEIFAQCLPETSEAAVRRAIEILSCDPSKGVIDLQYSPIFRSGNHLLVPFNLLAHMNWWRNLSSRLSRRAIEFADEEAGPRALSQILSANTEFSRNQYETKISGVSFELDAIARIGDYTFIFECKHPLLPCNAFELRTSWKHMKTGENQLDKVIRLLADPSNEKELYRRLGWACEPTKKIITCIVTFNGMFGGLKLGSHPVRRWHELRNFIETGKIRVVVPPVEFSEFDSKNPPLAELNLWVKGGEKVSGEDLVIYIDRDLIAKPLFDAMQDTVRKTDMGEFRLGFLTYGLDAMALHDAHVSHAKQLGLVP